MRSSLRTMLSWKTLNDVFLSLLATLTTTLSMVGVGVGVRSRRTCVSEHASHQVDGCMREDKQY